VILDVLVDEISLRLVQLFHRSPLRMSSWCTWAMLGRFSPRCYLPAGAATAIRAARSRMTFAAALSG